LPFEGLSDKLAAAFKRMRSKGRLSESDVKEVMREVRLALLEADVQYKVAKDFTAAVAEKAIGQRVMDSLTPANMVIKIVNDELTALMGSEFSGIRLSPAPPIVILLCGLQGSGKTTYAAKLARYFKTRGHRPMLVACDIYRPAAITQLQVVGERAGVPVFERGTQPPEKTAVEALRFAKDYGHDIVILDTAGRLHIDGELMAELGRVKAAARPQEILLVVDAMTGQDAVNVAKSFDEQLSIDGILLTKLDGDTRGGAALSARAVTGKPIKFAGTGEKLEDLEEFHPGRMASRILGMGDVLSLIERAEQQVSEREAREMAAKLQKNQFDMDDLLSQLQQVRKMGPLKQVLGMLPGVGSQIKDMDIDERQFTRIEAVIQSMTAKERAKPDLINPSRKRRIAAGSGTQVEDVNRLLKQYEQMKKLFKQMGGMKKNGRMRGMRIPPGGFPGM